MQYKLSLFLPSWKSNFTDWEIWFYWLGNKSCHTFSSYHDFRTQEVVNPLDRSQRSVIGSNKELPDCRKSTDFVISTYRQRFWESSNQEISSLIKNVCSWLSETSLSFFPSRMAWWVYLLIVPMRSKCL